MPVSTFVIIFMFYQDANILSVYIVRLIKASMFFLFSLLLLIFERLNRSNFFEPSLGLYRCKNFHTHWRGSDGCVLDFDHTFSPVYNTSLYNVFVYNIVGNVSSCNDLKIPIFYAIQVGSRNNGYAEMCYQISPNQTDSEYCDPTTTTYCNFTCPYYSEEGAYPFVTFDNRQAPFGISSLAILLRDNLTFPHDSGRMFTPEHNNTDLYSTDWKNAFIQQWCSEFDKVPVHEVEGIVCFPNKATKSWQSW